MAFFKRNTQLLAETAANDQGEVIGQSAEVEITEPKSSIDSARLFGELDALALDMASAAGELDAVNNTAGALKTAMESLQEASGRVVESNREVSSAVEQTAEQTTNARDTMSKSQEVVTDALANINSLSTTISNINRQLEGLQASFAMYVSFPVPLTPSPVKPIFWPSTQQLRRLVQARPAKALPWLPAK